MTEEGSGNGSSPPKLVTLPPDWPGRELPIMPGDFTKYVPQGLGLGPPLIVRPWDNPAELLSRPNFYGFDAPQSDPVRAGPSNLAAGGVIYFDDGTDDQTVRAMLGVMEVQTLRRDFAAFRADAKDTRRERFLSQLRIMSKVALGQFFGAEEQAAPPGDQALTIEEAVLGFLKDERARWNGSGSQLSGTLGGDGDWAKESLAFGFMVENGYWGVYRVWSRPWLVTK